MSRLVLGTAQLGMLYGIANATGKPDKEQANDILATAWENGVRILDTAQVYGDSEAVIGNFLKSHPQCRFDVITKLTPDVDTTSSADIATAVLASTQRLGQKPTALFLHSYDQLTHWNGLLGETLIDLQGRGEIGELGVSVYEPEEFQRAMSNPEITLIQAPFNVLDRRLVDAGLLEKARQTGRRVFLRSAFLQGLLRLDAGAMPPGMAFAEKSLMEWWKLLERFRLSPIKTALNFILQAAPELEIVVGCETAEQFQEIVRYLKNPDLSPEIMAEIHALPPAPGRLLNPSQWS